MWFFRIPAGKSCSLHRSGTRILRFPPPRGSQPQTKRLSASRPDGTPRTMSKLSLPVKARGAAWTCSLFFQNTVNMFLTKRTELLFECVVRDNMFLIFHKLNHWPKSCPVRSDPNPCGLPQPLGESCRFSVEHWRFSQNLDVDLTLTFILSRVCIGHRGSNCLSHCSRNLRQSWWDSMSELFGSRHSKSESSGSRHVVVLACSAPTVTRTAIFSLRFTAKDLMVSAALENTRRLTVL